MNIFNSVKVRNFKRQKFNLSHSVRLTTEFGRLTPVLCEPVLPADKFKISTLLKVDFAPMTFPVMERFKVYLHYFFVPNRLLWSSWEDFITGGESGTAEIPYPVIKLGDNYEEYEGGHLLFSRFRTGSLFDYLGFPALNSREDIDVSRIATYPKYFDALPFKAYQLVYNEWYRDQNLEEAFDILPDKNGNQSFEDTNDQFVNRLMAIQYRAWKKDYFTSALPDPQRGPDVTLPLVGDIDIHYRQLDAMTDPDFPGTRLRNAAGGAMSDSQLYNNVGEDTSNGLLTSGLSGTINVYDVDNSKNLYGDGSSMRSATINEVRRAFAIQRLYELAARVGGRYMENILGNFGVRAGDARLQRPEYLGGSVIPVMVGDVLQTSATAEDGTPLGMPAGVAGGAGQVKEFTKHFTEHGWILGILSVVPEATYMQGIPRKFLKRDRFDFAWPLLANIGEQEIQQQELFFNVNGTNELNNAGFGYAPRYSEYKFGLNSIHGDFRNTLADFHDARIFGSAPALNKSFIQVKPSGNSTGLNRIFAVTSEQYDHIWVNLYNDVLVKRKLPKYGTPI